MTTPCPPAVQREVPSRDFQPYIHNNVTQDGIPIAEVDPDRRSILIVSTVAAGAGAPDVWVISESTGNVGDSPKRYPLSPGEGVTLKTAAKVIVRSSSATSASVKVIVERGWAS